MEEKTRKIRLLDTDMFIDHFRGHPPSIEFFKSIRGSPDIIFSAVTETELIAGKECNDSKKKEMLIQFLHQFNKIEVTNQIAVLAGDIIREYGLDVPDAIIAASAIIYNAELLTRNVKDFKNIKNLKIRNPY